MQGLRRRRRAVAAQREGGRALWYLSVASVSLRKNEGENEEHGKGRGGRSVQVVFGKSSRHWRRTGRQRKIEMCLTKEILGLGNTHRHPKSAFEHPEHFSIQLLSADHFHNLEKADACSRCLAESNDFILSPVGSGSLHFLHSSG